MKLVILCFVLFLIQVSTGSRRDLYFDRLSDAELCERKRCGKSKPRGALCTIVRRNGTRKATCYCPTSCDHLDLHQPVCSMYGRQYENECELHLEACQRKKHIKIAYRGSCIASQASCVSDDLKQFPFRLLDWFLHLRTQTDLDSYKSASRLQMMSEEEREDIAMWKFHQLDQNSDDNLSQRELRRFRYALMPLEHCARPFFKKCDENFDNEISKFEWKSCFVEKAWTWFQLRAETEIDEI